MLCARASAQLIDNPAPSAEPSTACRRAEAPFKGMALDELRNTAYHEVVTRWWRLPWNDTDPVTKVTILPRGLPAYTGDAD